MYEMVIRKELEPEPEVFQAKPGEKFVFELPDSGDSENFSGIEGLQAGYHYRLRVIAPVDELGSIHGHEPGHHVYLDRLNHSKGRISMRRYDAILEDYELKPGDIPRLSNIRRRVSPTQAAAAGIVTAGAVAIGTAGLVVRHRRHS